MAIVYIHRRLDIEDEFKNVFYVGIGKSEKRAFELKHSRNQHWKSIVLKHGFSCEITHKNVSWEEACAIERYLISFYGRKDLKMGQLCNMTDGGDGVLFWSDELRNKHSLIQKSVQGTIEAKLKNRERALKRFSNDDDRKKYMITLMEKARTESGKKANSISRKNYFIKNGIENHIKIMKKAHGTIEARNNNRNAQINLWSGRRDLPTGVYKHGKGYRSKISINNKAIYILHSKSVDECHQAYLNFVSKLQKSSYESNTSY